MPTTHCTAKFRYCLVVLAACLLSGCGSPAVESIDFRLNDRSAAEGNADQPLLTVRVGDTIRLWDATEPQEAVMSRAWSIDGEAISRYANRDYISNFLFGARGLHTVELCVNGTDSCLARTVNVVGTPVKSKKPTLNVLSPTTRESRAFKGGTATVKVATTNVFNANDLSITLDGKPVKDTRFIKGADGAGEFIAKVRLPSKGTAKLLIVAETAEGETSLPLEIERDAGAAGASRSRPDAVIVIERKLEGRTNNATETVSFTARNVYKSELVITHNGRRLASNAFKFSRGYGRIMNLALDQGDNNILVTGRGISDSYRLVRKSDGNADELTPRGAPPLIVAPGTREGAAGVHPRDLAGCTALDLSTATAVIRVNQMTTYLETFEVNSSGCGQVLITMAYGQKSVAEVREVSPGFTTIYLDKIDNLELLPDIKYTLTVTPQASASCATGVPTLLNATTCGQSARGDARIQLSFPGGMGVFNLNYLY